MSAPLTGRCLCGGVAFEVTAFDRPVVACHCTQCRKTSGHYVAATRAPAANFRITRDETLSWYKSSDIAERGFCNRCGGNLFWRPNDGASVSIMAGTLDAPTGLKLDRHIYVADAGDYYDIDPGFVRYDASDQ